MTDDRAPQTMAAHRNAGCQVKPSTLPMIVVALVFLVALAVALGLRSSLPCAGNRPDSAITGARFSDCPSASHADGVTKNSNDTWPSGNQDAP